MLVCWVACPIFLVTTDVCFMRHAKCQVSSCSELKVTHGIPWSRIPFRILVISYKHPSKQTVESKRWRHPGLIERSSDQDVQCLWPSGGMVSCSEGHGQCRVPFDPQVIPSRATIWAAAFELGCSIWEDNFLEFTKSLCLMPTGLVTTWRLTKGAALESSLFSMMWWTKIVQLEVCFFVGLGILETEIQPLCLQPLSHWLDASTSVEWCSGFFLWKKSRLTGRMWTRHLQKVVHDRCPTSLRWDADHGFKTFTKI